MQDGGEASKSESIVESSAYPPHLAATRFYPKRLDWVEMH